MTEAEEDVFVFLDFDPEVSCESDVAECDRPVYWRMVKDCCSNVFLLCKTCGDQTQIAIKAFDGRLHCKGCKANDLPASAFHFDPVA